MNQEVHQEIMEWVESGDWKNDLNFSYKYSENLKCYSGVYIAAWFMDLTEEELEAINQDDDEDFYAFYLIIYIWDDNTFKLEFDPELFQLMYRGYDTEEDRNAWEEFKELTKQKGLLYEE